MTKIDTSKSIYAPDPEVPNRFSRQEIRRCEVLMRRLQFLESQTRKRPSIAQGNGGAAYAQFEIEALEWALSDIGYLIIKK